MYGFESYISVPILLKNQGYFGNLCALDPRPVVASDPRVEFMFTCFARLIGQQLDLEATRQLEWNALLDKNVVGNLRGLFVALMAHDLREPLHELRIVGREIGERVSDPQSQQSAERIEQLVERMTDVIENALGYVRDRSRGGIPLCKSQVEDLAARLNAVVARASLQSVQSKIVSNISIPKPVYCDGERVTQLAAELLRNALTHGSPSRAVSFVASLDGSTLVLEVWNDGAVIAPTLLKRLFEPFWHRDNRRSHPQLGLYLCAQIARAHAGTLKVTSAGGKGTTFSARIPTVAE